MVVRTLLPSLLLLLIGCADELVIGDAHRTTEQAPDTPPDRDASDELDASAPVGATDELDAASGQDAGNDSAPVEEEKADAAVSSLMTASRALASTLWISPPSFAGGLLGIGPEFVRVGFVALAGTSGGVFAASCVGGCPLDAPDAGSGRPPRTDKLTGQFTLYHITEAGTVYGALFTEDGINLAMHFQFNGRASVDEINIAWVFGDIPFRPQNSWPSSP